MNLYDFIKREEADFDTYDVDFDAVVTVCEPYDDGEPDDYDRFCSEVMKKVLVVRQVSECEAIVDWAGMIRDNIKAFRGFSMQFWHTWPLYEMRDEDDLVYAWINELHGFLAGNLSDDMYGEVLKLLEKIPDAEDGEHSG